MAKEKSLGIGYDSAYLNEGEERIVEAVSEILDKRGLKIQTKTGSGRGVIVSFEAYRDIVSSAYRGFMRNVNPENDTCKELGKLSRFLQFIPLIKSIWSTIGINSREMLILLQFKALIHKKVLKALEGKLEFVPEAEEVEAEKEEKKKKSKAKKSDVPIGLIDPTNPDGITKDA